MCNIKYIKTHNVSQIKESGLQDYTDWVEVQGEVLVAVNGRGDTKKIYEVVDALKGKPGKPPANLTTDGQGNPLCSADDVADRWYHFLSNKFSATEHEEARQGMPLVALPNTQGVDDLTEAQVRKGIMKMKANKACGPDGIPDARNFYTHSCFKNIAHGRGTGRV